MKIDGINLINDSSVVDARIENGDSLPAVTNAEDEGRMFWLKRSYSDYVAGLYVFDGTQWQYTNDNGEISARFDSVLINTAHTANTNSVIVADTSTGSFQLSMPDSPNVGDFVIVIDAKSSFYSNPLTIVRTTAPIRGQYENRRIVADDVTMFLFYTGTTYGWNYLAAR